MVGRDQARLRPAVPGAWVKNGDTLGDRVRGDLESRLGHPSGASGGPGGLDKCQSALRHPHTHAIELHTCTYSATHTPHTHQGNMPTDTLSSKHSYTKPRSPHTHCTRCTLNCTLTHTHVHSPAHSHTFTRTLTHIHPHTYTHCTLIPTTHTHTLCTHNRTLTHPHTCSLYTCTLTHVHSLHVHILPHTPLHSPTHIYTRCTLTHPHVHSPAH